jgi:cell pole-organizing protein PopZ
MSDAKSPSDLSMDEILAAIRRIIADDEQSSAAAGSGKAGAEAAASPAAAAGASGDTAPTAPASAPARAAAEDDVLELTEALNDDGTVRRLAPIGGSAPYMAGATREPPPPPVAAVPEADRQTEAEAARQPTPAPEPEAAPGPSHREPAGPSASAAAAQSEDRLVSEVTSLAAAAAFARLAGAPRTQRDPAMVGDKPLDEIVQDLLRPLLQTWLDENLSQIVERLVQAEIARIGRSGTG